MSRVIAIANQKGGVSKTTTTVNLGIGLARKGKKVLVIDADPQSSLTESLGFHQTDQLEVTLSSIMEKIMEDREVGQTEGILHHAEGIGLLPCNIELSGMEVSIINAMSRETIMKRYIDQMRKYYDCILIDCMPSLGMLTINAFAASDSVLIPVQAAYLPVRGLEQLIMTISRVKKHINPSIRFEGILISMVDSRTVYAREIIELVKENYGESLRIFDTMIPFSVRAAETSAAGVSIYSLYPEHKVTQAYEDLTGEVIASAHCDSKGGDGNE
ncbi:MAG: ParA family protein [Eubacterium sp.]|jgi:chromosome partitioning protein|nr:ParA family protein [Eubacterium sp.]